jgi:Domain of unknown function (DUF4157)
VLGSPGRPLDAETRNFMEPRFGHDFSHVRIHSDACAASAAGAVNAFAFTVGDDIVLLIIGLSIALLATILAALADPEPASKLALAGLTAAEISLLLVMLGFEEPGESGPTAARETTESEETQTA